VRVDVAHDPAETGRLDVDADLLAAFADRAGAGLFAVVALAAGELPEARHWRAGQGRAASDQVPALAADQPDADAYRLAVPP
jgi:hypothetical protein